MKSPISVEMKKHASTPTPQCGHSSAAGYNGCNQLIPLHVWLVSLPPGREEDHSQCSSSKVTSSGVRAPGPICCQQSIRRVRTRGRIPGEQTLFYAGQNAGNSRQWEITPTIRTACGAGTTHAAGLPRGMNRIVRSAVTTGDRRPPSKPLRTIVEKCVCHNRQAAPPHVL